MRISRHGAHRYRGRTVLVSASPSSIEWNGESNRLDIMLQGTEGNTTHTYRLELRPAEIAEIVRESVNGGCDEAAAKAFGAGMAAFIRAALPEAASAGGRK